MADRYVWVPMILSDLERWDASGQFFSGDRIYLVARTVHVVVVVLVVVVVVVAGLKVA